MRLEPAIIAARRGEAHKKLKCCLHSNLLKLQPIDGWDCNKNAKRVNLKINVDFLFQTVFVLSASPC